MRPAFVIAALAAPAWADAPYVPPPAESVTGYFAQPLPCKIEDGELTCREDVLSVQTLRELSILRNTIYARYGWDGYRKPWLKDYFHAQAWFKSNPKFTYRLLSPIDKKNAHFIAMQEQSYHSDDLERMKNNVYARHGKVFPDESLQSSYKEKKWYKPNPNYSDALLTQDDKIELGLISRASGSFSLDDEQRGKEEQALERLLPVADLRQLSLRDLRLLRNTIYARRGRKFKSRVLQDHFEGMDWYKPLTDYSDKLLSKNDQRNIALIKSVENEFGGPLSDEDWLTEPAVDGA